MAIDSGRSESVALPRGAETPRKSRNGTPCFGQILATWQDLDQPAFHRNRWNAEKVIDLNESEQLPASTSTSVALDQTAFGRSRLNAEKMIGFNESEQLSASSWAQVALAPHFGAASLMRHDELGWQPCVEGAF